MGLREAETCEKEIIIRHGKLDDHARYKIYEKLSPVYFEYINMKAII
jgi:hypothetical protein